MPEMTVAPNLPVAARLPAGGPALPTDGLDPTTGLPAEGADFAAVLREQLGQPGQGEGAEALIALLAEQTIHQAAAPEEATAPEEAAATLPDLAALLPDLAALLPGLTALAQPGAPAAGATDIQATASSDLPMAALPAAALPAAVLQAATAPATAAPAAVETGRTALPLQAGDIQATAEPGLTAARQPAVFAVAEQATAETAVSASAMAELLAPQGTAEVPTAQTQANAPAGHTVQRSEAPGTLRVDTPVGARGWNEDVGQKLVWLVRREDSRVELTLTPPHLGKVEVTISVSGEQTNALFVSASPVAREALEQALPRLRELLADAGITLGQASVNAESPRQERGEDGSGGNTGRAATSGTPAPALAAAGGWSGRGLIDTFA